MASGRRRRGDRLSVAGDVEAAHLTEPTPVSVDVLNACRRAGRQVVIVTNKAEEAILTDLVRFDLTDLVAVVVARTPGRPRLMKPHPTRSTSTRCPRCRPERLLHGW